jgi:speckle-type POZ protein
MMQYQNENICIAYFTGKVDYNEHFSNFFYIAKSVINLSCAKHRRFGLKVEDVYCKLLTSYPIYDEWLKMDAEYSQKNSELLHFSAQSQRTIGPPSPSVNFDVKFISTIGNYYYEMMDDGWLKDFWVAATNEKFTDVDIFVGTQKVMEVHRFILSARSPVMNVSLNKISNTRKSIVRFGAEFDVEVVKNFLNFLYTGSLKSTDNVQLLSKLATMYQVETLKNVCQPFQLINANPPDVEEVTDYLLQL